MSNIPQMIPWIEKDDVDAVTNYMNSGGFITEFKVNEDFEKTIADKVGSSYCISTPNGTLSLSLALMALNIGPGDEVIVPNYTMIATPNAVKMVGATPVLVDIELDTLWVDYKKLTDKINPRTKAVIVVAANGRYPNYGINEVIEICKRNEIHMIEDAAQALGSYYPEGKHIGTMGVMGSFSFSTPKLITTGQGGCLVTDSYELASKIRKLKDFGRDQGGTDIHPTLGFNFKFTDLQASLGLNQISKLEKRVKIKKLIYEKYHHELKTCNGIKFISNNTEYTSPWFYEILTEKRQVIIDRLTKIGIGTRKMYPPINRQKSYDYSGDFKISEYVGECGLWLPSFTQITDDQIIEICSEIKNALEQV
jgi:perosamine synthetase